MAKIDLCVVNYNTVEMLTRLCYKLYEGAACYDQLYTLRVADNSSTDGSVEMLRTQRPDNIAQVLFNDNVGYANASNQLAALGDAPIIGILNADVWLSANNLHDISLVFEQNEDISILGPKQRDEQGYIRGGPISWAGENSLIQEGWGAYDPSDIQYRFRKQCATVMGSAYFIRRSVWDELTNCQYYQDVTNGATGAFLPTRHFFEETFCSMHAAHHGYKVYFDGTISIGHTWRASTGDSPLLGQYFAESKEIYKKACDYEGIKREQV